mmetsp:Transcript_48898/g.99446  ORF Transcript_48898/g.99446 Transcript_48898/m.99446 type:complete len:82 (+) Transcript_48898:202-447(+)
MKSEQVETTKVWQKRHEDHPGAQLMSGITEPDGALSWDMNPRGTELRAVETLPNGPNGLEVPTSSRTAHPPSHDDMCMTCA